MKRLATIALITGLTGFFASSPALADAYVDAKAHVVSIDCDGLGR